MSAAFRKRSSLALVALSVALLSACGSSVASRLPASRHLPPIRHVFVIMLENESYGSSFGDPAADPYLARTLRRRGILLENYYATGHASADNYISIVSGQPPNIANQADCPTFGNLVDARLLSNGVESGTGCVYPANVLTIGNQLSARHLSWKGYMQDMGNVPSREAALCGHPPINRPDGTEAAVPGDGYAARHDPFVYFHSVIDHPGYCDAHVVPLGTPSGRMPASAHGATGLATDLRRAASTPAFSFITPNLCNDGHDVPCANQPGHGSAGADIDAFLRTWVPLITRSPAFRQSGLLEITFDEAEGDMSACCGEAPGPGAAQAGIGGPGGGRVGALLISPFIRGGTVDHRPYNHYSSLASWERLFGLRRLADAATVTHVFGADVFNRHRA